MSGWCLCPQHPAQGQDLELGDSSTVELFLPWLQEVLAAEASQLGPALQSAAAPKVMPLLVQPTFNDWSTRWCRAPAPSLSSGQASQLRALRGIG